MPWTAAGPAPATWWLELGHLLVTAARVYLVYLLVAMPVSVLACSAALGLELLSKPELEVRVFTGEETQSLTVTGPIHFLRSYSNEYYSVLKLSLYLHMPK